MKYSKRGLRHMKPYKPGIVRWGHLKEIDRRVHVGTKTWLKWPLRLQHLSSWRAMHLFPGGKKAHMPVRMYSRRYGLAPSSDLPLLGKQSYPIIQHPSKLAYVYRRTGRMK